MARPPKEKSLRKERQADFELYETIVKYIKENLDSIAPSAEKPKSRAAQTFDYEGYAV